MIYSFILLIFFFLRLVNAISPGIITQVNTLKSTFSSRTNLEMFLSACKKLGLTEPQLFNVEDLFEGKKMRTVAVTIHWLAYVAGQMDLPNIPPFDPMHLSRISLPSDQKQTLVIKKPTVPVVAPKAPEPEPEPQPEPELEYEPPVQTTPPKVDNLTKFDLKSEVDELEDMLNQMSKPKSSVPSTSSPAGGNNIPETSSAPIQRSPSSSNNREI